MPSWPLKSFTTWCFCNKLWVCLFSRILMSSNISIILFIWISIYIHKQRCAVSSFMFCTILLEFILRYYVFWLLLWSCSFPITFCNCTCYIENLWESVYLFCKNSTYHILCLNSFLYYFCTAISFSPFWQLNILFFFFIALAKTSRVLYNNCDPLISDFLNWSRW